MENFLNFARERYSVRKYDAKPVEEEKIAAILEAAKLAPTARNNQPQKIYVAVSEAARRALAGASPCTFGAPVVFVVCYDDTLSAKDLIFEGYDFGDIDSSIVCTHMMLEAHELGLGTCWVGYFREDAVRAALNIPANFRIRALLPTGYPAESSVPSDRHLSYRPMDDMVEFV